MSDFRRITVIGLGYVGLPTAALLARAGYEVLGVDVNEATVATLGRGECPLGERDVAVIVTEALASGHLKARTEADEADVFIICVPTPVTDEKTADLSMVRSAIQAAAASVPKGALVILESTSPVGTTRGVIGGALREAGLDPEADVDVCYCPERVFPGATIREILNNDRVVGGLTPRAAQRAKAFYETFCDGVPVTTSAEAAEFSKLMENSFRDVNIALANVFARFAEDAGVDVTDVIALANRHPRVNVHTPGPGVGGHCIPVDPWFLIEASPQATELLSLSRRINDGQAARLLDRAERAGLRAGARVAVLGAAYRADLDDAREAPTGQLLDALAARGYAYAVHDPYVAALRTHGGIEAAVTDDLYAATRGADAIFVMTEHAAYRAMPPEKVAHMPGRLIVDGRRVLSTRAFAEAGFDVVPLGAPPAPALPARGDREGADRAGAA